MRRPLILMLSSLILFPSLAWGQSSSASSTEVSPYRVDLAFDLPVTLTSGLIALSMDMIVKPQLPGPWCGLTCDPTSIGNSLDEEVVDNDLSWAKPASDVLVVTTLASPFVFGMVDTLAGGASWESYGEDTLIVLETLMVNFLLNDIVKYSVRRPRPLVYDPARSDEERSEPDSALSFYSLHSSFAFAAATSYSSVFTTRNPESSWVVPVWVSTHVLAATTAVLRVQAGKHFWTDVIVGTAAGMALGSLVPYLHERSPSEAGPSQALQAQPVFTGNGLGVALTW